MENLKTSYRASPASLRPTYTGGPVSLTPDGLYLLTTLHSTSLCITHIASARVVARIKGDGTAITAVAVAPNPSSGNAEGGGHEGGEYLVLTAHQSLSVRYYPFDTATAASYLAATSSSHTTQTTAPPHLTFTRQLTRAQTHPSPILSLSVSPPVPLSSSSTTKSTPEHGAAAASLFATGAADGTVKVWDTKGGFVTHVFRGHGGGVSAFGWRFSASSSGGNDPSSVGYIDTSSAHPSATTTQTTGYANAPNTPSTDGAASAAAQGRTMQLITGSVDTRIRIYDLLASSSASTRGAVNDRAGKPIHVLEGHVSVVRGLDVSLGSEEGRAGRFLVSAGRDRVGLVWDLEPPTAAVGGSKPTKGGKAAAKTQAQAQPRVVQTLLASESLETIGLISPHHAIGAGIRETVEDEDTKRLICYTGGEKGRVRLWDVLKGKEVGGVPGLDVEAQQEDEEDDDEQQGLAFVLYNPDTASTVAVHHDQNIVIASLPQMTVTRQIIGFNDEVIDSIYLSSPSPSTTTMGTAAETRRDTHLALATNSNLVRIYNTHTLDARLLSGHTDVVLCLDKSPDGTLLVTGSKDTTARIWAAAAGKDGAWRCVAVAKGHAEAVGAVAMARTDGKGGRGKFLFTASQDRTVKMWDLSVLPTRFDNDDDNDDDEHAQPIALRSMSTLRIHEKDINSLDVSPDDKLLVSGSQDKTLKLFSIDFRAPTGAATPASGSVKQLGVCKGHKRGVWSVKFSPTDRVVASAAADRTVRLWSLDDFTCIKTFEGHTNSVLRVNFLSKGMQLVSTASDGLVKLWNIKEEECVKTLDGHEDKIWALAISADEKTIVSGGADSVVNFWQDCSAEEQQEEAEKLQKLVADEQDYQNYVSLKDYKRAIQLALAMAQPGRLLNLFNRVYESRPRPRAGAKVSEEEQADLKSITGSASVDEILRTLSAKDLVRLLKFVRDWNTKAKTSGVAQRILETVVRGKSPNELMRTFEVATAKQAVVVDDEEDTAMEVDETEKPKRTRATTADLISLQDLLDGLMPYTERHMTRIERTLVDSYMVDYILGEMDGGLFDLGALEVDEVGAVLDEEEMVVDV
ncbi:hypothetical protein QFC22_005990 [Naganishia vaughanmartiniae]|uniref:Uncharacterized protein n=1 Tax=Naganishia vaughanmartiniae TaxID=1424756 RepID=A0ACC2WS93_9TREE|nr:hypothetical protein QFC22_005990 [Naganishia vaughanmartiniae]